MKRLILTGGALAFGAGLLAGMIPVQATLGLVLVVIVAASFGVTGRDILQGGDDDDA